MSTPDFAKMVPGFDFLQSLLKGAGGGMPSMSQWIAPTLDAEEVDKRIQELKTVQFWLESNAKMLAATIQALEVQRMTLATLRTMNLPMGDLRDALKIDPAAFMAKSAAEAPAPAKAPEPPPAPKPARPQPAAAEAAPPAAAPAAPAVDPMQWWGALTKQFTDLAAQAIKETPMEAASQMTQLAGAALKQAVQPMADAAKAVGSATAKAARSATGAAKSAAGSATKPAAKSAPRKTAASGKSAKAAPRRP